MTPFGPLDSKEELQSEEERLAVARRYREHHGAELRELVQPQLEREIEAVGEFSTVPIEALASIPILGAFFALAARLRRSRRSIGSNVLLAVDAEQLHLFSLRGAVEGRVAELVESWPRENVSVGLIRPRFMREEVPLEISGAKPLKLYASKLRTNPWAAAVVRALGGEAPEPLDLDGPATLE